MATHRTTGRTGLRPLRLVFLAGLALAGGYGFLRRRPKRRIPAHPDVIVSPAEGKVIHVEYLQTRQLCFFKRNVRNELALTGMNPPFHVVVIELHLGNVHVQRAPIAGAVTARDYFPGRFDNALYSDDTAHLARQNEKLLTVFESPRTTVAVVQVAGLVARRIRNRLRPGQRVRRGQLIGEIILGSQVVLVLGGEAQLTVGVGDHLTDGASAVATLPHPEPTSPAAI